MLGRLTSEAQAGGTLSYRYDAAGRRTHVVWGDGVDIRYDYLPTGALAAVSEQGGRELVRYSYDSLGRRIFVTRGNGTSSSYAYDAVSRLSGLTHDLAGTASDGGATFGYNAAGELATRTPVNAAYAWRGAYDVTRGYGVNGLNQLTRSGAVALGYDARGNLTTSGQVTYSYDAQNELVATSAGLRLAYDPIGRLHDYATRRRETRFVYDGGEIATEVVDGAVARRYVWGAGVDEPLVWYEGAGTGDPRWLYADERGSVIAVADAGGNVLALNTYDDSGIPGARNLGRFQYTGQAWLPELGLYDYKARMYSPTLGRFLQTDPIGYGDGLNLYEYAHDDPVDHSDPTGTSSECPPGSPPNEVCVNAPYRDEPTRPQSGTTFNIIQPVVEIAKAVCRLIGICHRHHHHHHHAAVQSDSVPQKVNCGTRLPDGKTIGDYVREQRATLQSMADAAMQSKEGPLPTVTGAMAVIAWPNGPIDFKNNFRGQGDAGTLGRAGNFAYYAIGAGIIPNAMLDAGGGAYAITSVLRGHKSWSTLTGPMFSDQSAASVRDAALSLGGCFK